VINPASFSIDLDTTGFPPFQVGGGGIAQQVKVPKKISFVRDLLIRRSGSL
jgi:hypothetical protein